MPRYEYECERCGPFEISQRIGDPAIAHHECGAPAIRVISATAFSLKGGGWYADGYGGKASTKDENKPDKTQKSEGKPADKPEKSESKPADKPEKSESKPSSESSNKAA